MFNFVLKKIRSSGPCKRIALAIPVIFLACHVIIMMTKKDVAVIPEPEKNKLETLVAKISCITWKCSRPQPMKQTKFTYIQRLWNYLN